MEDEARRRVAKQAAQEYAPRPESSLAMYAVVGIGLAVLGLALFGQFYSLDMLSHLQWDAAIIVVFLVSAVCLWFFRRRRHHRAYRAEYDRAVPKSGGASLRADKEDKPKKKR